MSRIQFPCACALVAQGLNQQSLWALQPGGREGPTDILGSGEKGKRLTGWQDLWGFRDLGSSEMRGHQEVDREIKKDQPVTWR